MFTVISFILSLIAICVSIFSVYRIKRAQKALAQAEAELSIELPIVERLAYEKFAKGSIVFDRKTGWVTRMDADIAYDVCETVDRFRSATQWQEVLMIGSSKVFDNNAVDMVGSEYKFKKDIITMNKLNSIYNQED